MQTLASGRTLYRNTALLTGLPLVWGCFPSETDHTAPEAWAAFTPWTSYKALADTKQNRPLSSSRLRVCILESPIRKKRKLQQKARE